jgi:arylsulfatase A-like enzyme
MNPIFPNLFNSTARGLFVVLLAIFLLAESYAQDSKKPNIVVILADDLGWMDLASYAARVRGVDRTECYYETPNLDRLADQGLSFSQAYACPLCSPARASILTGQYAARHGFLTASGHTSGSYFSRKMKPSEGYHIHDRKENGPEKANPALGFIGPSFTYVLQSGQPEDFYDALTIPEALKGYRSAMAGKWHLGALGIKGYQPQDQGFDEVLAYFDHGGSSYFEWREKWNEPGPDLGIEYLTDDLTERAARFIRECTEAKQPFFLYLPHFAVHGPREAKPDDVNYFSTKSNRGWNGHSAPEYAGLLRGLDNSVGKILDTVDELGIDETTLIIFMSDNGGIDRSDVTSNAPLRAGKGSKYEGGIRVPLIVRWPGQTAAGSVCEVPVDCNDIFPTILSAAGQDADLASLDLDGESLLPLFADPQNRSDQYSRDSFFWHAPFGGLDKKGNYSPAHSAMRKGNYKLLFDHQGYLELYDLSSDLSEENNLADQMPGKARQLFAELVDWLDATVAERYLPRPNPRYSPEDNAASAAPPYRDLRHELLGRERAAPQADGAAMAPAKENPALNMRVWAKGKPQQKDGSFVKLFVNPKGKTIITLRRPDGTEVNLSHKVLTPEDLAYLNRIRADYELP